jgi:signal peptidase II
MPNRYYLKLWGINLAVLILLAADRLTKWLIIQNLPHEEVFIIGNFFKLSLFRNKNIAFSLPLPNVLAIIFIIIILIFLFYFLLKSYASGQVSLILAVSLVITGAVGNLIDRLTFGYVIDFINIFFLSVFNMADVLIVLGVILWIVNLNHWKLKIRN